MLLTYLLSDLPQQREPPPPPSLLIFLWLLCDPRENYEARTNYEDTLNKELLLVFWVRASLYPYSSAIYVTYIGAPFGSAVTQERRE